jgi:exosortase
MAKVVRGEPTGSWMGFWIFTSLLVVAFSLVLLRLARFSFGSELESYIPLIPFVSVYLLCLTRGAATVPECLRGFPFFGRSARALPSELPHEPSAASEEGRMPPATAPTRRIVSALWWVASAGLLVLQFVLVTGNGIEGEASVLVLPVLAFVTGVIGGAVFFLGLPSVRSSLFPWLFLYLLTPIPEPLAHGLRVALQQGSAEAAEALFRLTGTPVLRDGLTFCLPGLTIQVAEECSGIHSSLVLLITSLVAGRLFLREAWSRTLLALLVIPVGLVRNGIRVVTVSLLTIHVNPGVIDGPLHHRGGPIFFAFSFGVLVAILLGLRWYERKRSG